jgi:CDP-diacylglycerol--glycerol-3-phosphate 3-phosphatidyltransferase
MKITPNTITLARIALIPVVVAALLTRLDHDYGTIVAFVVFAVAAFSDALDGYLARSRGDVSTLGIFLDPLADKLLITAALVTLVELDEIAAWVVVLILSREFAVTGLRLVAVGEGVVISAHWLGKLKTMAQVALVLSLIPASWPAELGTALTVIAVVLTVVSGIEYFWKGRDLLRDGRNSDSLATAE